ncbi:MAG: alpha/beta hydrolase [Ignavibacteria bacterium]|nr:alpha/beta hydrolase [Ignavibacteria bacterium]
MEQTAKTILLYATILISGFGCSANRHSHPAPPMDARAESFVSNAGIYEIGSENYDADFGTITVPENRKKSISRLMTLPVLRIHARTKSPAEPIFGLAGGPGQSNMSWGRLESFLPDHDFVIVGYRGVDGSTVLHLPEVEKAFKGEEDDLLGEASMRSIGQAWSAGAQRLTAQGIDLDGYTMLEVIEDMESVRRALGYERIHLLSESYGTRVAYLYGLTYPARISRSAMIGVNPPGHFVWDPGMIDAQLRHYAALWSKDSLMSLRSQDLYATMRTVLSAMPRKWLLFSIDPGKVKTVTFSLLFHRATAAMVFDAYVAAEQGDPSGLALMSFAYDYVLPSMINWADLGSKAVSADFDSTQDYLNNMEPPNAPLGSPLSKLLWGPLRYGRWPTQQLPETFRKPRESDVETLLLSGNVDFSTPAEFATSELLPFLRHGRQIILSECGHVNDVWDVRPKNTRHILTSFYKTGVPDTSMNEYAPMDFHVSWSFPALAKVGLGTCVFIIAAITGGVVWWRRSRKASKAKGLISRPATNS